MNFFIASNLFAKTYQVKDLAIGEASKNIDLFFIAQISGIVLLALVLFTFLYQLLRKIKLYQFQANKMTPDYVEKQLNAIGFNKEQKLYIGRIAHNASLDIIEIINNPEHFFTAVDKLYETMDNMDILPHIFEIRELLGFTIRNPAIDFTSSHLIPVDYVSDMALVSGCLYANCR